MAHNKHFLKGKNIAPPAIQSDTSLVALIDQTFNAYNAARFREACHLFTERPCKQCLSRTNLHTRCIRAMITSHNRKDSPTIRKMAFFRLFHPGSVHSYRNIMF